MNPIKVLLGKHGNAFGNLFSIIGGVFSVLIALAAFFGWLIGKAEPLVKWIGEPASFGVAFLGSLILLLIVSSRFLKEITKRESQNDMQPLDR